MNKRDKIFYDYKFGNIKPKKFKWKIYCFIRKLTTIRESPSKIMVWALQKGIDKDNW